MIRLVVARLLFVCFLMVSGLAFQRRFVGILSSVQVRPVGILLVSTHLDAGESANW